MTRKSTIFGNAELELLEKRIKGDKKDPQGLWYNTVKPKVKELVKDWIPRERELKKIIRKEQERCVNCGRFLGSYTVKASQDWEGIKKGDSIDIYGCKHCEDFTIEGHTQKKKDGRSKKM